MKNISIVRKPCSFGLQIGHAPGPGEPPSQQLGIFPIKIWILKNILLINIPALIAYNMLHILIRTKKRQKVKD